MRTTTHCLEPNLALGLVGRRRTTCLPTRGLALGDSHVVIESQRQPQSHITREASRLRHLQQACERAREALSSGPVFGLDLNLACGPSRRVRFAWLESDDKVQVTEDAILVHADCPERLARGRRDVESAGTLAALYFVHELAHLPQGIGDYSTVRRLRSVDEEALLHLDLAADHVAALVLQRVTGRPLAELKELQAVSLCGFPSGLSHSPEARARKARRMVSVCADALLSDAAGAAGAKAAEVMEVLRRAVGAAK